MSATRVSAQRTDDQKNQYLPVKKKIESCNRARETKSCAVSQAACGNVLLLFINKIMSPEKIKQLSKEALKCSIDHGYRDHETPPFRICTKAICEVAEAVSAYRDGKFAKVQGFSRSNKINESLDPQNHDRRFMENYRARVKDSVQDELADVVIYLLILISKYDEEIPDISRERYQAIPDDFVMAAGHLIVHLRCCEYHPLEVFNAVRCIDYIERWMYTVTGDDLEYFVEHKMKFNRFRPFRHGRKDDPTI